MGRIIGVLYECKTPVQVYNYTSSYAEQSEDTRTSKKRGRTPRENSSEKITMDLRCLT